METSAYSDNPLVILNPAANRGDMGHYREVVRNRTEQEHAQYMETTRQGEAKTLAGRAAEEGRPMIIVGGDGSIHEVVNGILSTGRRVPLGIVAAGTGNDYAWNTLKLPHDPTEAIEGAFTGRLVDADAGIVNEEYFANSFSVGLDANIAVAAERLKTFPFMSGSRLYYSATLQQLLFGVKIPAKLGGLTAPIPHYSAKRPSLALCERKCPRECFLSCQTPGLSALFSFLPEPAGT